MSDKRKGFETKEEIDYWTKRIHASLVRRGSESRAEDCAQEFFLGVLEGKHQHQTVDQFVIDYLRKFSGRKGNAFYSQRLNLERADSYESRENAPTDFNLSGAKLDDRRDVVRLVELLAGRDREIARLYYLEGYNALEIANKYQISQSRVSQRLKGIQSCLHERATKGPRVEVPRIGSLQEVLSVPWERMEFKKGTRMALEESREIQIDYVPRYSEWLTPEVLCKTQRAA